MVAIGRSSLGGGGRVRVMVAAVKSRRRHRRRVRLVVVFLLRRACAGATLENRACIRPRLFVIGLPVSPTYPIHILGVSFLLFLFLKPELTGYRGTRISLCVWPCRRVPPNKDDSSFSSFRRVHALYPRVVLSAKIEVCSVHSIYEKILLVHTLYVCMSVFLTSSLYM